MMRRTDTTDTRHPIDTNRVALNDQTATIDAIAIAIVTVIVTVTIVEMGTGVATKTESGAGKTDHADDLRIPSNPIGPTSKVTSIRYLYAFLWESEHHEGLVNGLVDPWSSILCVIGRNV